MAADILIVVECALGEGGLKKSAAEVATAGRTLADASGGALVAVVAGCLDDAGRATLAAHGVDKILHAEGEAYDRYLLEPYAAAVQAAAEQVDPLALLLAASTAGKELGAYVAAKLGRGYISDVTAVSVVDGGILTAKPRFAGKAIAEIAFDGPAVVSLRPNSIPPAQAPRDATVETLTVTQPAPRIRLKEVKASGEKRIELSEADKVVAGGRGLGGPDNWGLIENLATALGAAQGASRAVVDAGWRPHAEQVGQTGKTVSPKLYIAAGISGAIQHLAGMSSSKVIVAVNKDGEAPIFKVADYGIIGDVNEVLPMLTEAVQAFE